MAATARKLTDSAEDQKIIDAKLDALEAIWNKAVSSEEKLAQAKEEVGAAKTDSIRNFVKNINGWNAKIDEATVTYMAKALTMRLYGKEVPSRVSEFAKAFRYKHVSQGVLNGVDAINAAKLKADPTSSPLHIRETFFNLMTRVQKHVKTVGELDDQGKDLKAIIALKQSEVVKAKPTDAEKMKRHVEALSESPLLREKIGDATVLSDRIEGALQDIRNKLDGQSLVTNRVEDSEEYKALQDQYDDAMRQLHEAHEQLAGAHTPAEVRSDATAAAEDEPAPDTTETTTPPQSLSEALPAGKQQPAKDKKGKGGETELVGMPGGSLLGEEFSTLFQPDVDPAPKK